MPRLKLLIAYDGTSFRGWQSQKSDDAVQDIIERALRSICKKPVRLHGSGRTDAGVHALGQVAHADVELSLTSIQWTRAINALLPEEIRVLRARYVTESFHARFSAAGKEYRYELWTGEILPPHLCRTVCHYPWPIDLEILKKALSVFVGTHDFAAFSARGTPMPDTSRTIYDITVRSKGPLVRITYKGNGFLYKMVRMLTAAALRVASEREPLSGIREKLQHPHKTRSQHVAAANGLTLVRVLY